MCITTLLRFFDFLVWSWFACIWPLASSWNERRSYWNGIMIIDSVRIRMWWVGILVFHFLPFAFFLLLDCSQEMEDNWSANTENITSSSRRLEVRLPQNECWAIQLFRVINTFSEFCHFNFNRSNSNKSSIKLIFADTKSEDKVETAHLTFEWRTCPPKSLERPCCRLL